MTARPGYEVSSKTPPKPRSDREPTVTASSNAVLIETKNASINTLAVTIRAMHVNSRQMTLAVFRQLPTVDPYCDDGRLDDNLECWGLVRYEIKDQGGLWLVASYNGVLYRGDVNKDFGCEGAWNVAYQAYLLKGGAVELNKYCAWEDREIAVEEWRKKRMELEEACPWSADWRDGAAANKRREWLRERLPEEPASIPYTYGQSNWKVGERAWRADAVQACRAGSALARRAKESRGVLLKLPQLFIAV